LDLQYQIYAGLLFTAALLNIRQLNMLALTSVSALYLLVLPLFLEFLYPTEVPDTAAWYGFLIVIEVSYMICAVALRCGLASWAIVAISGWNIVAHTMGAYAYLTDGPFYYLYPVVLTIGEICQLMACLIMSRPIMRLLYVASQKLKIGRTWHGWGEFVGHTG
jgi:hypothetical protein